MSFDKNDQYRLQTTIKKELELFQQLLSESYNKVSSLDTIPENLDDMLGLLVDIFNYEEQTARKNSSEHERTVRIFAQKLMNDLLQNHGILEENKKYKELCGTIYAAYGCFQTLDDKHNMKSDDIWEHLGKQYQRLLS